MKFVSRVTAIFLVALLLDLSATRTNPDTSHLVEAFSVAPRILHHSKIVNYNKRCARRTGIPVLNHPSYWIQSRELGSMLSAADAETEHESAGIRNVVIAGGGIIGTSVAYYLVQDHFQHLAQPVSITLVDPTGRVGSCASGKAGGFLARDWRNGTPLQELQQTGFRLHQELADAFATDHDNDSDTANSNPTDYRRLTCAAVAVDETDASANDEEDTTTTSTKRLPNKPPSKKLVDLEWVDPDVVLWDEAQLGTPGVMPMGDEDTIAQVHPRKLCETMFQSIATNSSNKDSSSANVQLLQGKIVRALTDTSADHHQVVKGVELDDGRILPSDVLVIACGPWTYEANQWFASHTKDDDNDGTPQRILPDITAIKCHSILVPSSTGRPNTQAVFFDSNGAIGEEGDLEVYPRPDGDSYVNGFANEEGVCVEAPGQEAIEPDKIDLLREAMDFVEHNVGNANNNNTSEIGDEPFERPAPRDHTQQVCYWPETPSGLPIIGKIPQINGAYVAAGHSVWGILQGPATGKGLAELIVKGESECVDLTPFAVERYMI